MKRVIELLGFALCVVLMASCSSDDEKTVSDGISRVEFTQVERAVTDGVGTFSLEVRQGDAVLALQLTAEAGAHDALPTGTYGVTRFVKADYSVLGNGDVSYWTLAAADAVYEVCTGHVTVVTTDGGSVLSGVLGDGEGSELHFTTPQVTFSPAAADGVTFTEVMAKSYAAKYGKGNYQVVLATADRKTAVLLSFYHDEAADAQNPVLPAGRYQGNNSGTAGSLLMSDASCWLEAATGTEHYLQSASCEVAYESGKTLVEGYLVDTEGEPLRFSFEGRLSFKRVNDFDLNFYNSMAGAWEMNADEWLVYNRKSKEWEPADKPNSTTKRMMQWIGVPDYRMFYASGLFDANNSGMFVGCQDAQHFTIGIGYRANPMFMAMSSSSEWFYLYPALYDPRSGYFTTSGTIDLVLNDGGTSMQLQGKTTTATNPDTGAEVEINYTHFGVFGYGASSGKTILFSNWSFAVLPTFDRVADRASATAATRSAAAAPGIEGLVERLYSSQGQPVASQRIDGLEVVEAIRIAPAATNATDIMK